MCGFLGEYTYHNHTLTDGVAFEHLLAMSKHRGPDDTHVISKENYRLGFNRLAILDLSIDGRQPKITPSKRYSLVFNGEIYNYKDLIKKFSLSNLSSSSDTEVLLHLIDVIGFKKAILELNGMFAIMLIDNIQNTVFLARDFAGIKPLFYGVSKKGIVAASQFNQVFKHPWFEKNLNLRSNIVKAYFSLGYMLAPDTIYKDIFQVKPGEIVKITKEGKISKQIYFNYGTNEVRTDFDNVLDNAVEQQLVSDVPLGTFLSGGIDSPIITGFAKNKNDSITSFTLALDDDNLDESKKAKAYADSINCVNHQVKINTSDLLLIIDEHFKFLTEPFGDYSSIPTYAVTKGAKKYNTVMLSGDGGDELFLGYPRMLHVFQLRHWFKVPFSIRKYLARISIKLGLLKSWAPYNFRTLDEFVYAKQSYISEKYINQFFNATEYPDAVKTLFETKELKSTKDLLRYLRTNEIFGHLQRVLIKVDRMSMANSLEVRVPFLDKQVLLEALSWLPHKFNSETHLKLPLKKILERLYPKKILVEKKQGFAVPIEAWLKEELKSDLELTTLNTKIYASDILNVKHLKSYIEAFLQNKHNEAWGVWHIYAWQKWAIKEGLICK